MRNPGWNTQQAWTASCDVTFNGLDFGPNLQYGKLTFLPAENRLNQLELAGMPGVYDYSKSPAGYPVPKNMKAELSLFVLDPFAWQNPVYDAEVGTLISPEGRFLGMLGSGPVRLDFINSNRMYLMANISVKKYTRFDLGFDIVLSIDAEPYWWESEPQTMEWSFSGPAANLFDPEEITISPTLRATCEYTTAAGAPNVGLFLLHAPNGWYADVEIPDLDPEKTYSFCCRNIYNRGVWQLYDDGGEQIFEPSHITGTESLTLRLISRSAEQLAVGFRDVVLYDVTGAGVQQWEIQTLDAPVRTVLATANKACTVTIDGQEFRLEAAENQALYGLNIPPRSKAAVLITGESGCRGFINYQRGARSCTL